METTAISNPLGLTVFAERPGDLTPYNEANRPGDLAAITASMEANGWQGIPLVLDDRGFESGGYLLTGSHRHAAASTLGIAVPCVSVTEIAELAGLDINAFNYGDGVEWEQFFESVPAEIREQAGFDL